MKGKRLKPNPNYKSDPNLHEEWEKEEKEFIDYLRELMGITPNKKITFGGLHKSKPLFLCNFTP